MTDWTKIAKIAAAAPIAIGNSQVSSLIPRGSGTGLVTGFSVIEPGSMTVEMDKPELFIILDGQMSVASDGEIYSVGPNEMIWFPAGTTIQLTVAAPCRVIYAILDTPAA